MDGFPTTLLDTGTVRLAHELAMGIRGAEEILKDHGVDARRWERLKADRRFGELLSSKIAEWNGAANTPQRVRIKALALLELNLDQFQDAMEEAGVPAKIEVAKLLAKLGGMDGGGKDGAAPGGAGGVPGFSVRIFIGNDKPVLIEGQAEPVEP